MYSLFSVEVIHAQNCSQKLALSRLSKVVVMIDFSKINIFVVSEQSGAIELWFQHNKMVKYESSDNIFYENLM